MAEVILMPRLSDTMTEGVIAAWHKKIGDQVKKGDLVVTSGQEGIFPEGLAVGRVFQEVKESTLYRSFEIIPFPNFTSVNEVLFMKQAKK